jgi:hypothetical protein
MANDQQSQKVETGAKIIADPRPASDGWTSRLCLQLLPSQLLPGLLPPELSRKGLTLRALLQIWRWDRGEANKTASIDWWTEVVAQRTGNGGGMEGGSRFTGQGGVRATRL